MNTEEMDQTDMQSPTPTFATIETLSRQLRSLGIREGSDRGSPHTSYAPVLETSDLEVGLWTSTEGGWPITNREDTEIVYILSGRARITTEGAGSRDVGPGDLFVLPAGWTGRWDILEPVEKLYVTIPRGQEN